MDKKDKQIQSMSRAEKLKKVGMTKEQWTSFFLGLYNIVFLNDIATGMMFDAITAMKKKPNLYKQKVKFWAKKVNSLMKGYDKVLKGVFSSIEFVADINEEFSEVVKNDMMILRLTTLNYMHKCRVPDPELWTDIEIAYVFAQGAIHNVRQNQELRKGISRQVAFYDQLLISGLTTAYTRLHDEVAKFYFHKDSSFKCDLNDNNDIYNGFVVIVRKLANPELIAKVVNKVEKTFGD